MERRNQMKLELLSMPKNVKLARVAVAAFASELDYNVSDLEEIKVAVSEAVSNAIIHGYENQTDGIFTLTVTLFENSLEIVIEDQGKGIQDLKSALEPSPGTDPERMGLGFTFMRSFMDGLDVESEVGRGTKVIMHKNLPDNLNVNT